MKQSVVIKNIHRMIKDLKDSGVNINYDSGDDDYEDGIYLRYVTRTSVLEELSVENMYGIYGLARFIVINKNNIKVLEDLDFLTDYLHDNIFHSLKYKEKFLGASCVKRDGTDFYTNFIDFDVKLCS